jgi:hypothetical protein
MNDFIFWAGIILAIIFLLIYIFGERKTRRNVRSIHEELSKEVLPTVSAGSHYKDIPAKKESVSTTFNAFRNSAGLRLDTDEYNAYLVQGNSMQYCDIHTGDIVFSPKGFRVDDLNKFPSIIILKNNEATSEQCQYKIRRAWKICQDNLSEPKYDDILKEIMESSEYIILKEKARDIYESDDEMLKEFKRKLDIYINERKTSDTTENIVISSTYNVDDKKIKFSIHRISSIMGMVKYVASVTHPQNKK